MITNYDKIALICLDAVVFSVIMLLKVININIINNYGAQEPLTNNQETPNRQPGGSGVPNWQPGGFGTPNLRPGGPRAPN